MIALGSLDTTTVDVIPAITDAIQDEDVVVRRSAVEALVRSRPHSQRAVATLSELLNHERPEVVLTAVTALGRLGGLAGEALPALRELVDVEAEEVRKAVNMAIRRIKG